MDAVDHFLLIEKVLLLKALDIFSNTPEDILAELVPIMQEEEIAKDAVIFSEGEPGDCMYIIQQGSVRIHKGNTVLAILKEKEVFGELSLLDAATRSATATADSDCFIFRIGQEPFYELVDSRPEIAKGFLKILCLRLRQLNDKAAMITV
ncbi:MAG TPA: Crp/Fnr family transcriptional regulator [Ferruginibacter sp.]|nr:Crp/Fnr family transcriptional regulator [Ferruginibacter sp.]